MVPLRKPRSSPCFITTNFSNESFRIKEDSLLLNPSKGNFQDTNCTDKKMKRKTVKLLQSKAELLKVAKLEPI